MANDGLITSFLGQGTAAARPASPTIASDAIAFYWATDTNALSIWREGAWASIGGGGDMLAANNLSDVANVSTSRSNLGLGTGDSPQFTAINLGHASDTTISRVSAGVIAVEGVNVVTTAGNVTFAADISVPDEAYDATNWNGSVEVPTKNAVRDKFESLSTGSLAFIGRTTVTTLSNIDIPLSDSYVSFLIEFFLAPGTDNVNFSAQVSDDNFSSVKSGASDYRYTQLRTSSSSTAVQSSSGTTSITLFAGQGNDTNEYIGGKIEVINAKESKPTLIIFDINTVSTAASFGQCRIMSDYVGTQSINGLRIAVSSGNATGFYRLWGRKNT